MDKYLSADLINAVSHLFSKSGMAKPISQAVAQILVEADLMGYTTHGLQFVPAYLAQVEAGKTRLEGSPKLVQDNGSVMVFDADLLPGQWAMLEVLEQGLARVKDFPMVSLAVRRSGNISCLATYAKKAAEKGLFALVTTSAPGNSVVAPHGGSHPLLSTNPIAFAVPADEGMILADTSTASISNRAIDRARRTGETLPEGRVVDSLGSPSSDPEVLFADPPGAILPLGGLELGHKGFVFSLLVEALTSGLSGAGRAEGNGAGNNVFLLLIDPEAFNGLAELKHEMGYLRRQVADDEGKSVRLPGERALALYDEQLKEGLSLQSDIIDLLKPCFERYDLELPQPIEQWTKAL